MEKFFGILSAIIVLASYPVYILRIWQRKIIPNISSWTIFVLVSVALCLSSFASGGKENSWVTFGPLLGCTVILISALIVSKEKSMTKFDITCLVLACVSISLWFVSKQGEWIIEIIIYSGVFPNLPNLMWALPGVNFLTQNPESSLYLGIFTDFMGIVPSINFLSKNPEKDRPGMWIIFSIGYFLSMFAITENTFANWVLPSFMVVAPALVWFHLVKYRLKNKIPLKEWI
jgi:hypothetical protein